MIKINSKGSMRAVSFEEDMTINFAFEFQNILQKVLEAEGLSTLVVDLSQVKKVDNSGIGALVAIATKARAKSIGFFLYQPCDEVLSCIDNLEISNFFTILTDEAELLCYI